MLIHTQELQMQSKLLSVTSSVFHFEHEQVVEGNRPVSTCSAVVIPKNQIYCNWGQVSPVLPVIGSLLPVGQMSAPCKFPPIIQSGTYRQTRTTLHVSAASLIQHEFTLLLFLTLLTLHLSLCMLLMPQCVFSSPLLPLVMYSYRCSNNTSFLNEVWELIGRLSKDRPNVRAQALPHILVAARAKTHKAALKVICLLVSRASALQSSSSGT